MPEVLSTSTSDDDVPEVLSAENTYITAWRNMHGRNNVDRELTGLALSGGGIRSAIYCLGVLQALAKHDVLKNFDYLSTVSGGGYIGTSLTWCTSKNVRTARQGG